MCCQVFNSVLGLLSARNKCKGATWGGRISGARCSNRRVLPATPAASLSRTLQNAPPPIPGPPLTGVPARGPAESLSGRNLNSPQVKVCLYLFMDSLIPCHVLKSTHYRNKTNAWQDRERGRLQVTGLGWLISSFVYSFFLGRYFSNPFYVHL